MSLAAGRASKIGVLVELVKLLAKSVRIELIKAQFIPILLVSSIPIEISWASASRPAVLFCLSFRRRILSRTFWSISDKKKNKKAVDRHRCTTDFFFLFYTSAAIHVRSACSSPRQTCKFGENHNSQIIPTRQQESQRTLQPVRDRNYSRARLRRCTPEQSGSELAPGPSLTARAARQCSMESRGVVREYGVQLWVLLKKNWWLSVRYRFVSALTMKDRAYSAYLDSARLSFPLYDSPLCASATVQSRSTREMYESASFMRMRC